jgi:hypothetical protein
LIRNPCRSRVPVPREVSSLTATPDCEVRLSVHDRIASVRSCPHGSQAPWHLSPRSPTCLGPPPVAASDSRDRPACLPPGGKRPREGQAPPGNLPDARPPLRPPCGLALPGESIPPEDCLPPPELNDGVLRPGRRCGGPVADLEAEGVEQDAPFKDQHASARQPATPGDFHGPPSPHGNDHGLLAHHHDLAEGNRVRPY